MFLSMSFCEFVTVRVNVSNVNVALHSVIITTCRSNRIRLPENPLELTEAFDNIQELYLNRMDYDWSEVNINQLII